jgi:hypothetical protein
MTADGDRDGGDVQPRDERDDRPELDFESAFADLKLRFETQVTPGVGPWPAAEDLDEGAPDPAAGPVEGSGEGLAGGEGVGDGLGGSDRGRGSAMRAVSAGEDEGDAAADGRQDPPPADPWTTPPRRSTVLPVDAVYGVGEPAHPVEDDAGYSPPEPPPLPRGDLISRLAWAGVIGGPVFLLLAALVWRDLPPALLLGALVAFVGGFVTLVARMPGESSHDGDDGAVV